MRNTVQTTRWRTEWTGRASVKPRKLRLELVGVATCRRTEKHTEGGQTQELGIGCPRTPKTLRLDCTPAEVVAGSSPVKVWRCRSPRVPPGTVMPWVFGIDVKLVENLRGEPRPEADYSIR